MQRLEINNTIDDEADDQFIARELRRNGIQYIYFFFARAFGIDDRKSKRPVREPKERSERTMPFRERRVEI